MRESRVHAFDVAARFLDADDVVDRREPRDGFGFHVAGGAAGTLYSTCGMSTAAAIAL